VWELIRRSPDLGFKEAYWDANGRFGRGQQEGRKRGYPLKILNTPPKQEYVHNAYLISRTPQAT